MTLRIYPVVLQLVRKLSVYLPVLRARSATLGDQLERALLSIPLNVAEGAYSRGKNRQARYQSAAASAVLKEHCVKSGIGSSNPSCDWDTPFPSAPWHAAHANV